MAFYYYIRHLIGSHTCYQWCCMFAHISPLALLFCIFNMYAALFFLFQSPTVFLSCHFQLEPILLSSDILNHHILHIFLRFTSHSSNTQSGYQPKTPESWRDIHQKGTIEGSVDCLTFFMVDHMAANTLLISSLTPLDALMMLISIEGFNCQM